MRRCLALATAVLSAALASPALSAPDDPIRIELNTIETTQNRCRMVFVVENKGDALDSLKLDLAVFDREGVVRRRVATDLGPVRRAKTIVKSFELDGECGPVGSVLVNDVTACTPGDASACLDRLALSSRAAGVRLYK